MTPASIKFWRERFGWSQAEAARQLGTARNTYMGYESGAQPIPLYIALACQALANGLPPMK
jgi:transcriptional regulator with XRE-family HTH domain